MCFCVLLRLGDGFGLFPNVSDNYSKRASGRKQQNGPFGVASRPCAVRCPPPRRLLRTQDIPSGLPRSPPRSSLPQRNAVSPRRHSRRAGGKLPPLARPRSSAARGLSRGSPLPPPRFRPWPLRTVATAAPWTPDFVGCVVVSTASMTGRQGGRLSTRRGRSTQSTQSTKSGFLPSIIRNAVLPSIP